MLYVSHIQAVLYRQSPEWYFQFQNDGAGEERDVKLIKLSVKVVNIVEWLDYILTNYHIN